MDRVRASKLLGAALGLTLVLAGCASDFGQRFDEAERLRQQAAERGYEWLGTAELLEQAEEQASLGDTEAALALVDEARFQAEAALHQAELETEAWKRRVPR
jgi:hypothetical protein